MNDTDNKIRRMSHFIQNTRQMESSPLLETPVKRIVVAPIKPHRQSSMCDSSSEQKMIDAVLLQYKNQEYEHQHEENATVMQRQFQLLKNKIAKKSRLETVENILEGRHLPKIELSQIIRMSPKIDLMKKYRSKIYGKLSLFREAESIRRGKAEYCEWYDHTKNNPMQSPAFTKMTYLLQKLKQKSSEKEEIKVLRNMKNSTTELQRHSLKQRMPR